MDNLNKLFTFNWEVVILLQESYNDEVYVFTIDIVRMVVNLSWKLLLINVIWFDQVLIGYKCKNYNQT